MPTLKCNNCDRTVEVDDYNDHYCNDCGRNYILEEVEDDSEEESESEENIFYCSNCEKEYNLASGEIIAFRDKGEEIDICKICIDRKYPRESISIRSQETEVKEKSSNPNIKKKSKFD